MINRWMNPRRQSLRDAIEQMFEDPFFNRSFFGNRMRGLGEEQWVPVNIFEHQEGLMVVAPMPGLQAEDVDISVSDNTLTLRGNRTPGQEDREYMVKEWDYGPYQRSIELPFPVDMDHVAATLDNGVLTVNLRKSPSVMPRRIEVRSGGARESLAGSVTGGETQRSFGSQQDQGQMGEQGSRSEDQRQTGGYGSQTEDVDRTGGV